VIWINFQELSESLSTDVILRFEYNTITDTLIHGGDVNSFGTVVALMGFTGTDLVAFALENDDRIYIRSNTFWVDRGDFQIPNLVGGTEIIGGEGTSGNNVFALIGNNVNYLMHVTINLPDPSTFLSSLNTVILNSDFNGNTPNTIDGSSSIQFTYVGTQQGDLMVFSSNGDFLDTITGTSSIQAIASSPDPSSKYVITSDINFDLNINTIDPSLIPTGFSGPPSGGSGSGGFDDIAEGTNTTNQPSLYKNHDDSFQ